MKLQITNKTVQEDIENSNSSLASEGCANRRKYKQRMERETRKVLTHQFKLLSDISLAFLSAGSQLLGKE